MQHDRMHQSVEHVLSTSAKSVVHPITYYEQLAEAGALYDFLQTTMHQHFRDDTMFRRQMLRVLLERSPIVLPEVEYEILFDLSNALSYFLTTVEQCHAHNKYQ